MLEPTFGTQRRRTLSARRELLEAKRSELERRRLTEHSGAVNEELGRVELELALLEDALEPLTLAESLEDLRAAWRRLIRTIVEALRS